MNINSLQLNSIKFTGAKFSPVLNRVRPLVTKPNVNTFDRSMKIVGIATSALFLATGAMNKSNEIISWKDLKNQLSNMKNSYGQKRFSKYCIEEIEKAYNKNSELTIRLINLKQKGKWFINFGEDILSVVAQYDNHPIFSEAILKDVEKECSYLLSFLKTKSTDQEMLKYLYDYRDEFGGHLLHGQSADLIIDFYKKEPNLCKKILNTKNPDGKYAWVNYDIENLIYSYTKFPRITLELMDINKDDGSKFEAPNIKSLAIMNRKDRDFYTEVLKNHNLTFYHAIDLYNSQIPRDQLLEMLDLKDFYGNSCIDSLVVSFIFSFTKKQIEKYKKFFLQGLSSLEASTYAQRDNSEKIEKLIEIGVSIKDFEEIFSQPGKYEKTVADITKNPGSMREFFADSKYFEKILQNSAGKYQKELVKIFEKEKMPYKVKEQLIESGLTAEEFLESLKKISKSCFRLAYDTPNQYLSDINIEFSTLIDGHYPKLSEEELNEERKEIIKFFVENIGAISRVLKYIDNDTFNHLMDKRTELFKIDLENLNKLSNEKLELLSKLLKCKSKKSGKGLSPQEKVQICQIVMIFSKCDIDSEILEKSCEKGILNIKDFKKVIEEEVLKAAGINVLKDSIAENKKLNEDYAYLTLEPKVIVAIPQDEKKEIIEQIHLQIESWREDEAALYEEITSLEQNLKAPKASDIFSPKLIALNKQALNMLKHIDDYTNEELLEIKGRVLETGKNLYFGEKEWYTTIRVSILDDFKKYIMDTRNNYGKINAQTKREFIKKGLDYEKWLKPSISELKFNVAQNNLTIDLWNRNPLEDLFIGNKTTCCTAIGRTNGGAVSAYLLGTCWSVVELKTEKGDTVGMSRVFWADVDGKPALIMDNIELNNNFNKSLLPSQKKEVRNNIFKYMREYAKEVSGKNDVKVYFCSQDTHVPVDDLKKIDKIIEFIGKSPTTKVYVNAANCSWITPSELKNKEYRWYIVQ